MVRVGQPSHVYPSLSSRKVRVDTYNIIIFLNCLCILVFIAIGFLISAQMQQLR